MIKFFMMVFPEALVVFAKYPDPQTTKTRLSPPLSLHESAGLYACFLADTLAATRQVSGVDAFVAYDPPEALAEFMLLAPDFQLIQQVVADLGERMHQAFNVLFARGYRKVVLIGSDLPHLPIQTLVQSFQYLRRGAEVVLGPSADGGYYLIGLNLPQPQLFNIQMSTPYVLGQTLERIERLGLQLALLPENFDIDTAADLKKLRALLEIDQSIPASYTRGWFVGKSFQPGN
jgi:uncharacterized protein